MAKSAAEAIERFAKSHSLNGRCETREAIDAFNAECGGIIPDWYCTILERFPICGVELELPDPSDADDSIAIEWMDLRNMRSEMLECYPGLAIHERGYICIGGCTLGSGDQYYICNQDGDDPPVYQIYHDVSDVADEIIAKGRNVVFDKLSKLLDVARLA